MHTVFFFLIGLILLLLMMQKVELRLHTCGSLMIEIEYFPIVVILTKEKHKTDKDKKRKKKKAHRENKTTTIKLAVDLLKKSHLSVLKVSFPSKNTDFPNNYIDYARHVAVIFPIIPLINNYTEKLTLSADFFSLHDADIDGNICLDIEVSARLFFIIFYSFKYMCKLKKRG